MSRHRLFNMPLEKSVFLLRPRLKKQGSGWVCSFPGVAHVCRSYGSTPQIAYDNWWARMREELHW